MATSSFDLTIKPRRGWQPLDLTELWNFRGLLGFLVWRDVKVRYKQTALGGIWAIVQPLIGMLIFGTLFTRVAPVRTDGSPYPLFVFAGLVPWTFFANAVSLASNSLIGSEQMIRKTYFPRLFLPLANMLALGLDLLISLIVMAVLLVVYRWRITVALAELPLYVALALPAAAGPSFILSALNVKYRDIKYIVPFLVQTAFFVTPVLYPSDLLPRGLRVFESLNPMAGVIDGFRHALLGSTLHLEVLLWSSALNVGICIIGVFFFRRVERSFADLI